MFTDHSIQHHRAKIIHMLKWFEIQCLIYEWTGSRKHEHTIRKR